MSKTNVSILPSQVIDICRVASAACSCSLYGTFVDDHTRTISIFIEDLEGGNIRLEVCEKVMKHIQLSWPEKHSALLKNYYLEVSSPGINKPLLTLEHYQAQLNQPVVLKHQSDHHKPKTSKGILSAISDDEISVTTAKQVLSVKLDSIISCHLNNDIKV